MNEFNDVYFPFPETEDTKRDIKIMSADTWGYIDANQSTMACLGKPKEDRGECWQKYLKARYQ